MKVKVDRNHLFSHLQMAQNVVEKKTTLPILSHILLETLPSQIQLSSTDLEVGVTDTCEAEPLAEGSTTVHAKKFFEIVRELPEGDILLEQKDENLEIRAGRSLFRLRSLSPGEFPKPPAVESNELVCLKGDLIQEMIQKVSLSISSDETRYTLTGVLVQMERKEDDTLFRMITTDGHRLSFCERSLGDVSCLSVFDPDKDGGASDVILPRKAVQEMKRITEEGSDLQFGVSHENAFVTRDRFSMIMRLVQGKFPDYKAVIPSVVSRKLTIGAKPLERALRRVSLLSTEKARGARFLIEQGRMTVSSMSPEIGEAEEQLDLSYEGEPFDLSFNVRYLLDYLQIAEGDIDLEFGKDLRPCLIRSQSDRDHLYVVMPLRT